LVNKENTSLHKFWI